MDNKKGVYGKNEIRSIHPTELRRNGKNSTSPDNIHIKDVTVNTNVVSGRAAPVNTQKNDPVFVDANKLRSSGRNDTSSTKGTSHVSGINNVKYVNSVSNSANSRAGNSTPIPSVAKAEGKAYGNVAANARKADNVNTAKITAEKEIYTRNLVNLILCAAFALIIIGMGFFVLIHLLDKNKPTYSEFEKRNLESAPSLTLESLYDGTYTEDFDRFFSDNFPMREMLVEKATDFKRLRGIRMFKKDAKRVVGGDTDIYSDGNMEIKVDEDKFTNAEQIVIPGLESGDGGQGQQDFVPDVSGEMPQEQQGDSDVHAVRDENVPTEPTADSQVNDTESNGESAANSGTAKGEKRDTLYLVGDTAFEYFRGTEKSATDYVNVVNAYAKYIPADVNIYTLVIPTHPEFGLEGADRAVSNDQKPVIEYIGNCLDKRVTFVNPYDKLYSAYKNGEYLYFRTDHHWTIRGAYLAYKEFCEKANITAVDSESYETGRIEPFLGSFYSASNQDAQLKANPDYVEYFKITTPCTVLRYDSKGEVSKGALYYRSVNGEANGYLAFMGGDFPYVNIKTENDNGKVLMIFKESFANPLIGLLAPHFSEIHVADIRYFPYNAVNFISQYGVTDVLFCNGIMSANSSARVNDMLELMNK